MEIIANSTVLILNRISLKPTRLMKTCYEGTTITTRDSLNIEDEVEDTSPTSWKPSFDSDRKYAAKVLTNAGSDGIFLALPQSCFFILRD